MSNTTDRATRLKKFINGKKWSELEATDLSGIITEFTASELALYRESLAEEIEGLRETGRLQTTVVSRRGHNRALDKVLALIEQKEGE